MSEALKEARNAFEKNEVPVGAVISDGTEILSRQHNRIEELQDATAHAEMLAIREVSAKRGNWRLDNLVICVTLEPCTMCIGSIMNSRIGGLIYGVSDPRAGACGSIYDLTAGYGDSSSLKRVVAGVAENECLQLLQQFFSNRRS